MSTSNSSTLSRESFTEIIIQVMVESETCSLSQDELYSGLCKKSSQLANMASNGWKRKVRDILILNECFQCKNSGRWRLHPVCMDMVSDGNYNVDAMNRQVKEKRQSILHKVRLLQCSQRNNTNQLPFNCSPLHQCSPKKRKRADDATNDQKEFAARVRDSMWTNSGNSTSDSLLTLYEVKSEHPVSESSQQHSSATSQQEPRYVRQEATDTKPVQMLNNTDFSYGDEYQELQCPRSTSVSAPEAQPHTSEDQQHMKAELLTHPTSDEEGSSVVPDANDVTPVALFWNPINSCAFDRPLGDEQEMACCPGVNSNNTEYAEHCAHHEQPQANMEEQDSVIVHDAIDIRPRLKIKIQREAPDDHQEIDMEEEEERRQVIDIRPRLKIRIQ